MTGSFSGKGNAKQLGAFMKSDTSILNAFSAFGDDSVNPSDLMSEMERYICLLYGQNMDTKIEGICTLANLKKWLKFTQINTQ